jgi:spectinomycin phosphotransferase/16S rRNA (guanine(1405)-N(7))-methyltransferase
VLDMLVAIHTAPRAAARHALADDFAIPHRDELEAALAGADAAGAGPYAGPLERLVAEHAGPVRARLDYYDEQRSRALAEPARPVVTHGEPHPGNTMLTPGGWRLIDWDTALIAPPERDLWDLDPGDGSVLARYAAATGTSADPGRLELYRARWDLADLAACLTEFRRPHTGTENDEMTWRVWSELLERISA